MIWAVLGLLGVTAVGFIYLSLLLERIAASCELAVEVQRQILGQLSMIEHHTAKSAYDPVLD